MTVRAVWTCDGCSADYLELMFLDGVTVDEIEAKAARKLKGTCCPGCGGGFGSVEPNPDVEIGPGGRVVFPDGTEVTR